MRHVTVRPPRVLPCGRTRRVEQTLLSDQPEWRVSDAPCRRVSFRPCDLFVPPTEMYRRRPRARGRTPRDRAGQRLIDLERRGAIAIRVQPRAVRGGQLLASDHLELS